MADVKGVEVFDEGTNNGIVFESDDLDEMHRGFKEQGLAGKLPVKIGHTSDDRAPAMGWIDALYRKGSKLLADLSSIPDDLIESIKAGRFRHVSIELLKDVTTRDGNHYRWLPDGLAILGAARPAVESLAGLNTLFQRRSPGMRFAERLGFNRTLEESETLRAENKRLRAQSLTLAIDNDIRTGRVMPAERVRFMRRFGNTATVEDWQDWCRDVPRPSVFNQARPVAGRESADSNHGEGLPPDQEVAALVREEVEKSDGKLTFSAATTKVLRAHPTLADAYRHQPGVK